MEKIALRGNVVLADEVLTGGVVVLEGEKIAGVHPATDNLPAKEVVTFEYGANYITPGLIDLHLHGAMGHDVIDASGPGLASIATHQARCGVTGFVATTLAAPVSSIVAAVENVKAALSEPLPSEILGVYLEGPFLNLKKKGAQNPDFIKPIDREAMLLLVDSTSGLRAIVTVAPEAGENLKFIPALRERGVVISIGHSDATYELAMQSFDRGITHATHLYNAMSGFLPREPGVIGAVLDSSTVMAELIADGVHVHPAALRLAIKQKGVNKICLVTDSLNASGLGDGDFRVGGLEVAVRSGQARLKEGGALAGSVLTLNRAVKNIVHWADLTVCQGINMASLNPARVLGIDDRFGSIQLGRYANLAIFDEDLNVVDTILRGRSILRSKFGS
jgi:N-acetylglucosamine-6-phosphate deacetylase